MKRTKTALNSAFASGETVAGRAVRDADRRAAVEFGVSADAYRSDVTRRTSRVGAEALRLVLSALVFGLALWGFAAAFGGEGGPVVNLWVLLCALAVGVLAYASIHVVLDWERLVVLRFGKYNRISGPGLVLIKTC